MTLKKLYNKLSCSLFYHVSEDKEDNTIYKEKGFQCCGLDMVCPLKCHVLEVQTLVC